MDDALFAFERPRPLKGYGRLVGRLDGKEARVDPRPKFFDIGLERDGPAIVRLPFGHHPVTLFLQCFGQGIMDHPRH